MSQSPLKLRINEAMKEAMRAKNKSRLGTIRLALAEIKKVEVDEQIDLDDKRITSLLEKMVKQSRESIPCPGHTFSQAGSPVSWSHTGGHEQKVKKSEHFIQNKLNLIGRRVLRR